MKNKRLVILGLMISLAVCSLAWAADAIQGYDTVAYFTDGKAVRGSSKHKASWNGSTWLFASADHKKKFQADPQKYAPQYDGNCVFAASKGSKAIGDPTVWTIVDGKLYLNYNANVKFFWEQDRAGNIEKADQKWPAVKKQ